MVAIIQRPEFRKPITEPRDWSHRFDNQQPPLKGEVAYVVMLVGVKRKAKWRPTLKHALPPVAFVTGSGLFTWTRSLESAMRDVGEFNASQIRRMPYKRFGVKLWAVCGWGVCGFDSTVQFYNWGAKS